MLYGTLYNHNDGGNTTTINININTFIFKAEVLVP